MWRLTTALGLTPLTRSVCVFSFVLATPTQNYALFNFWPSHYVMWTAAPWLLLFAWRLLEAEGPELRRLSLILGVVGGVVLATTHPGHAPVYATVVSTGRHNDEDKSKDHRTIQGEFRIREKHIAATMEDDGASDGPYSIQDVPWIMYFEGSYALHGAFWHSMFGRERSHGCVNMTPHDAKHIFGWSTPTLPPGWHGIRATKENPGTRVVVHEDPKPAAASPGRRAR